MLGVIDFLCLQIILNRRKDVEAWDKSFRSAVIPDLRDNWWLKALSIFSPDYFWLRQITLRFVIDFFNGSFEKYGVDVYKAHYRQLEDLVGKGRYLEWTVEDGWCVVPLDLPSACCRTGSEGSLHMLLTATQGSLCASSWISQYRKKISPAATRRQRSWSILRKRGRLSTDRRVSMWPRLLGWCWLPLLRCGWDLRG